MSSESKEPAPRVPYDRVGGSVSVAFKIWGLGSGPLQTALLLSFVSPETQGNWYAISGLQRFQSLLELGVGTTLAAAIARSDRPGAWLSFGLRWHLGMCLGWVFLAGPLGAFWLLREFEPAVLLPWVGLVLASGLGMPPLPILTSLEARQQVAAVSGFRMAQGVGSRLLSWIFLVMGGGIWAQVLERMLATVGSWIWLWRVTHPSSPSRLSDETKDLLRKMQVEPPLAYGREIFPLQWRIAMATAGGTLPFAVLIPMVIQVAGKVEGGRLGASLAVLGGIQGVAWAVLTPTFPEVGRLLAAGERAFAARQLGRVGAGATALLLLGTLLFVGGVWLAPASVSGRFSEPLPLFLLGICFLIRFVRELYASWCRADLRPVTWPMDLVEGIGVVGAWWCWGDTLLAISLGFVMSSLLNLMGSFLLGRVR